MKIGLDFGTTRIVVAAADRGNYPLVNFEASNGRVNDWFPSVLEAVTKLSSQNPVEAMGIDAALV